MKVKSVVFSGGEPLVRRDIIDILEYARKKGLGVTLLTNGILIDRSSAVFFASMNIRVKISIDGVTAGTHDFLRGSGSFSGALQALAFLKEAGAENRSVHFTVHRKNLAELHELAVFLPSRGIRNVVVGTIKPSGRALANRELLIPPVMVPYVRKKVHDLEQCRSITLQSFSEKDWEGFGCPAVCNKFGITARGRATTCVFFGEELLGGSIRKHSLRELWEHYRAQGCMFTANSHCRECPALPLSGGGCRARAWYYLGSWNAEDPYCCALHDRTLFVESHKEELCLS